MFTVYDDGSIELTRGDTAYLSVPIQNEVTGEAYDVGPEDTLTLTVKKSVKDAAVGFQKIIQGGNTFHIKPEDTRALDFGKYKYDVQLDTADGDVYTVIGPQTFEILSEVTV